MFVKVKEGLLIESKNIESITINRKGKYELKMITKWIFILTKQEGDFLVAYLLSKEK